MRAARTQPDQVPDDAAIDAVLALVLSLPAAGTPSSSTKRLDALFRQLKKALPSQSADDLEDLIWALWIAHPDARASASMVASAEAMAAGALDLARPMFDAMIAEHPAWAEAWNKRATLAFIERRDLDALRDIKQVLELEPRHFGAVSGFAQICVRHGRKRESIAAFQVALAINPHLNGIREAINDLGSAAAALH